MTVPDRSEITDHLTSFYDGELRTRAGRPLGDDRERAVGEFTARLTGEGARSVLEVGCGAGRDGLLLVEAGLEYVGCDLSPAGAEVCRDLGLDARVADATNLPFDDQTFDAAWSMSTLMHLPGTGLTDALAELRRVVRLGGLIGIGVWGSDEDREWTGDPHGRFFLNRSDATLQRELAVLGQLEDFRTWAHLPEGGHYQWACVRIGG